MNLIVWAIFGLIEGVTISFINHSSKGDKLGIIILGILGAILGGLMGALMFGRKIEGLDGETFMIAVLFSLILLVLPRFGRRLNKLD